MKKRFVASMIAALTVCTGASGVIGYSIGGNNAREAAAIEKNIEMEKLQEESNQTIVEMRNDKINAALDAKAAHKDAADMKSAKQGVESEKSAVSRAAKELKASAEKAQAGKKTAEGQLADMKSAKEKAEAEKKDLEKKLADELARRDAEQKEAEERKQLSAQKKSEIESAIMSAKADGVITEDEAGSIRGMVADARAQKLNVAFTYGELESMNLSIEELKSIRISVADDAM